MCQTKHKKDCLFWQSQREVLFLWNNKHIFFFSSFRFLIRLGKNWKRKKLPYFTEETSIQKGLSYFPTGIVKKGLSCCYYEKSYGTLKKSLKYKKDKKSFRMRISSDTHSNFTLNFWLPSYFAHAQRLRRPVQF